MAAIDDAPPTSDAARVAELQFACGLGKIWAPTHEGLPARLEDELAARGTTRPSRAWPTRVLLRRRGRVVLRRFGAATPPWAGSPEKAKRSRVRAWFGVAKSKRATVQIATLSHPWLAAFAACRATLSVPSPPLPRSRPDSSPRPRRCARSRCRTAIVSSATSMRAAVRARRRARRGKNVGRAIHLRFDDDEALDVASASALEDALATVVRGLAWWAEARVDWRRWVERLALTVLRRPRARAAASSPTRAPRCRTARSTPRARRCARARRRRRRDGGRARAGRARRRRAALSRRRRRWHSAVRL